MEDGRGRSGGGRGDSDVLVELARSYTALLADRLGADLKSVALFRSVARGEAGVNSDIDLLVIAANLPERRSLRHALSMEVEDALEPRLAELRRARRRIEFSPILKTPEEAARLCPLYLDMTEDAVVLHDPDGFFQGIMERMKRKLAEYGPRRVKLGRVRYWDLKPDYKWGDIIRIFD